MVQMNLSAKQKERHRRREQMYGHQGGKAEWDELGGWDWHKCTTVYKTGLPQWLSGSEFPCSAGDEGDSGSIPGSGRSLGEGHGNPLHGVAFPWTGEPGGLQPMGSHRVGHDWSNWVSKQYIKIGNYWEPAVQHRERYSVFYGDLDGKEIQTSGIYGYTQLIRLLYSRNSHNAVKQLYANTFCFKGQLD